MPEYHDFELEISSDSADGVPRQYFAHVIRSPAGEASRSPVQFRFSKDLARVRADLESAVLGINGNGIAGLASPSEQMLREFGKEVFRSIFVNTKSISNLYAQCKRKDLRIKLRISSPDLAALPWEYLYEEDEVISYLSLRLPLVRYLETAGAAEAMGVRGPLRILGMISAPVTDEWPKLEVARERERIDRGIDKLQREGRVVFEWVDGGTGKDLMAKLLEGDWHIFHFIGHGGVEPQSQNNFEGNSFDQSGFIVMVDEDGRPAKKFASDLAIMLGDARKSLRLVVLNCCESAKINVGEKFGNPAIGLMLGGWLPAVVAMQFPISDGAAIEMSEGFYRALANNSPVDDAIKTARKFIQMKSKVEFGIPVLYMRSPDGKIFEVDNPVADRPTSTAVVNIVDLQRRREEFMLAVDAAPNSIEELEQLTHVGQNLISGLKDDEQLTKRVARVYLDLGTLQQRNKQTPNAAGSFAYAIKLDPRNPEYYVRRANFYALVGFYEFALADITAAIGLKPGEAEYYWIKGIICGTASGPENKRGFLEQAVEAFGAAIRMRPSEPKYLASRANAFTQLGVAAEAIKDLDLAMTMAPDNPDLVAQRMRIQA
ncbi:CHAT domain-containing tetratricopeptide repeat protein [Bradyrhizobium sp. P5_C12]